MTSETGFLALSALLWVSIIAGWAWWVGRQLRRRRRLRTWPRVRATVTQASWTTERVAADGPSRSYRVYRGDHEFTDPAGGVQRGEHSSTQPLVAGDALEVVHDPGDPSSHEPVDRAPVWAVLLLLALGTLGVGLFAVITLGLGLGW